MQEDYNTDKQRYWLIWVSVVAVLLIGVGIFFYHHFFKQSKSELIDAVPTDAVFLFEINDHHAFTRDIASLRTYFNELFAMDALPAYETVYNSLPEKTYDLSISGHSNGNGLSLLFNTRLDEASFKKLLKELRLDPSNYSSFEQQKIYTFGTDYKSLKIAYCHHILSISDNLELLKKSIVQQRHPKNLLSEQKFKELYRISEKNRKQNWLFIKNQQYADFLKGFFNIDGASFFNSIPQQALWSAFQLRMTQNEIFLSGYIASDDVAFKSLKGLTSHGNVPENEIPFSADNYCLIDRGNYSVCSFTIQNDSLQTRYLLASHDTLTGQFDPFDGSQQLDTLRNRYPNNIFPVTDQTRIPEKPAADTLTYTVFTVAGDQYLFAVAPEDIVFYNKEIASKGELTDNRYYKFSKSNIASSNVLEYAFFNNADRSPLLNRLSEKGKLTQWGKDLRIICVSCHAAADNFVPLNIYINFGKTQNH
jgi:hypothetical protein